MNREQRRQAARAGAEAKKHQREQADPRAEQVAKLFNMPIRISWSDGRNTESTLSQCFTDERDYERYKGYKLKGKPYPVRVDAVEPTEPHKESSIFPEGTAEDEYKLLQHISEDFTRALQRYLELTHDEQIEQATAIIMRQAEEATAAMSKDIPDLEGAELKV